MTRTSLADGQLGTVQLEETRDRLVGLSCMVGHLSLLNLEGSPLKYILKVGGLRVRASGRLSFCVSESSQARQTSSLSGGSKELEKNLSSWATFVLGNLG